MFAWGGGEALASKEGISFLGRVPIDPKLVECGETGKSYLKQFQESPVANTYKSIASKLITITSDSNMDVDK